VNGVLGDFTVGFSMILEERRSTMVGWIAIPIQAFSLIRLESNRRISSPEQYSGLPGMLA
jgi:hypothetical protein